MEQRGISAVAVAALVGVLALGALAAAIYAVAVVGFGWEATIGEGLNSFFAHDLAHGHGLYRDPGDGTALYPIYAPGFYLAQAPFELGGLELWPGRLISVAGFAGAGWAAFAIARRLGCTGLEASASALGIFASSFVVVIASAGRPDGLSVGLLALVALAATRWEDRHARSDLVLAALAAAALLLTRQSYLPMLLAPLISFALRDRRAAIGFGLGVGAVTMAVAGLTELASGGAFSDDLASFAGSGSSLAALRGVLENQLLPFPNPILAVGAVAALAASITLRRGVRSVYLLWFASLLTLAAAAKLGSAANYWLPTVFASAVLLGPALARLRLDAGPGARAALAAGLALLLVAPGVNLVSDAFGAHATFDALGPVNAEAVGRIEAAGGSLLGDRHDLATASGNEPVLDAYLSAEEERNGAAGPEALAARVRAGDFAVIQSSVDLSARPLYAYQGVPAWPQAVADAVAARYCPAWSSQTPSPTSFGIWLYEPCPRAGGRATG